MTMGVREQHTFRCSIGGIGGIEGIGGRGDRGDKGAEEAGEAGESKGKYCICKRLFLL